MLSAAGGARRLVRLALGQAEPAARDGRGQALSETLPLNLRASWMQGKPRKTKEKPCIPGAYTTRNAPAPENGDEIVSGPIERPVASHNTSKNTVALRARRARVQ